MAIDEYKTAIRKLKAKRLIEGLDALDDSRFSIGFVVHEEIGDIRIGPNAAARLADLEIGPLKRENP